MLLLHTSPNLLPLTPVGSVNLTFWEVKRIIHLSKRDSSFKIISWKVLYQCQVLLQGRNKAILNRKYFLTLVKKTKQKKTRQQKQTGKTKTKTKKNTHTKETQTH